MANERDKLIIRIFADCGLRLDDTQDEACDAMIRALTTGRR